MISRSEHMINALIQRLEELKRGEYGPVEEMTFYQVAVKIFDVLKNYAVDRRDLLQLFGMSDLTPQDAETIAGMNYEDNSN